MATAGLQHAADIHFVFLAQRHHRPCLAQMAP